MAVVAAISCRLPRGTSCDCFPLFRPLPARIPRSRACTRQPCRRRPAGSVRFVLREVDWEEEKGTEELRIASDHRMAERKVRKEAGRRAYLIAAVISSLGITSMAVAGVYYRSTWQMEGGEVPATEMLGTFALSVGAAVRGCSPKPSFSVLGPLAGMSNRRLKEDKSRFGDHQVGMEFWARWAHRALWHAALWHMHESHHRPRDGPFELNDVMAIVNAVPAIAFMAYGLFNCGLLPGLCFGAVSPIKSLRLCYTRLGMTRTGRGENLQGLGITLFGMAYMFVHDGLVHRRFPVGPIANIPYFRRVAAAHQELEEVDGLEELEKEIAMRNKLYSSS
uniref:beta-carotene 3-hydroxylase n=1 Tax=Curcuma alismatifolia TaxID=251764 RepID=A0A7T3PLZ8_9LILI|nr:Beta-carotene 3-hydroxylase 1 [Curcuma alismatifolia]